MFLSSEPSSYDPNSSIPSALLLRLYMALHCVRKTAPVYQPWEVCSMHTCL